LNDEVTAKGFKALSNLHQLEEFIFFVYKCHCRDCTFCCFSPNEKFQRNTKNLTLCMQHLPNLRVAGQKITHGGRYPFIYWVMAMSTAEALLRVNKPCTLGLQEMTASSLPDGIELLNLTSLQLCKPSMGFLCGSRLSKVSELGLYQVKKDTCIQILTQIGQQLKILRLDVVETIEIDIILGLCPNLQHLEVLRGPIRLSNKVDPTTLGQLNILELKFDPNYAVEVGAGMLLQLLQAPELRKLVLVCKFPRQQGESMEIISMLKRLKILQKLEQATLQAIGSSRGFSDVILNYMTVHCPNLTDVSNLSNGSMFDFCWNTDNVVRPH
jgi:hypothetical protein